MRSLSALFLGCLIAGATSAAPSADEMLAASDDIRNPSQAFSMTVTLTDGRVLKQRVDKLSGWVGNPLTREQRMIKFHSCAKRVLAAVAADRIVDLVEHLEQLQSVEELMTLVRA